MFSLTAFALSFTCLLYTSSIEELNEMYEMIEELPDYIVECLDEFISHYGTLEEVVEHKDDIYYYPCLLYTSNRGYGTYRLCISC